MEYGAYDFVESVVEQNVLIVCKVCIRTLKRAKPSEIEMRKITMFLDDLYMMIYLNKIFVYNF